MSLPDYLCHFSLAGSHNVRLCVHLGVPVAVRDGTPGARAHQDEHGYPNDHREPVGVPAEAARRLDITVFFTENVRWNRLVEQFQ